MIIGLCGAHRTGKTTLAKELIKNEKLNIEFVPTKTVDVFKKYRLHPNAKISFNERILIQNEILNNAETIWLKNKFHKYKNDPKKHIITDRTPIDMIAYTLCNVIDFDETRHDDLQKYLAYKERCFKVLWKMFDLICVLQPGIKIIFEEYKASLNKFFIENLNVIIKGLLLDEENKIKYNIIPKEKIDLKDRIEKLETIISYNWTC